MRSVSAASFGSRGDQRVAVDVDFLEHLAVQLVELAQALERVEQTRQRAVAFAPGDRHAREADVRGLGLLPRLDQRIERIAMRAGVPEELQHLDLPRGHGGRLRRHDARVVDALLPQRRRAEVGRARPPASPPRPSRRPPPAAGCGCRCRRSLSSTVSEPSSFGRSTCAAARPLDRGCLGRPPRRRRAPRAGGCGSRQLRPARAHPPIAACRRRRARGSAQQEQRPVASARIVSEVLERRRRRLRMSSADSRLAMVGMMPPGPAGARPRRSHSTASTTYTECWPRRAGKFRRLVAAAGRDRGRPCTPECREPCRRRDRASRRPAR